MVFLREFLENVGFEKNQKMYHSKLIGIIHVLSCINACCVLRKLFEHKVSRLSVKKSSEEPDISVYTMKYEPRHEISNDVAF